MIDVPAHVQVTPHIQNQVAVEGGTNWDVSRSAAATPIQPYVPPAAVSGTAPCAPVVVGPNASQVTAQALSPTMVVLFAKNKAALTAEGRTALQALPKEGRYALSGHASSGEKSVKGLALARAKAVALVMKKAGLKVSEVKSFGATQPTVSGEPASAQRVDVTQTQPDVVGTSQTINNKYYRY